MKTASQIAKTMAIGSSKSFKDRPAAMRLYFAIRRNCGARVKPRLETSASGKSWSVKKVRA